MNNLQPKPILLTFEMPPGLWVNTFRSTATSDISAYEQSKIHKLPYTIARATDYKPAKMYLLSSEPIKTTYSGWNLEGQWEWDDAPIRSKSRLFQELNRRHFRPQKRTKIGNQWVIEGPEEVKDSNGQNCSIWLCADFQYVDIEGKDGISVEISRKVQATKSIWDELKDQVYGLNNETKEVRVKVRDSSDDEKFLGRKFVKISKMNLTAPAWEGAEMSVAEYWNQDSERYSDEDARKIPVVLINRYYGDDYSRYPADQVFRVMSMENWSNEVRERLSKYLNLSAIEYLRIVKKSMRWFGGWELNGQSINLSYGWNDDFDIKHSDSRKILKLPDGNNLLTDSWRWFHNVQRFESHHSRPPPSVEVHFVVPPGSESLVNHLKRHAEFTFSQIPYWGERVTTMNVEQFLTKRGRKQICLLKI